MQDQYTPSPLLEPLRRQLPKRNWQNLVLLVLAVQLGRTLVGWQLSLFFLVPISSASCYRRLERFLSWKGWKNEATLAALRRAWVRAVLRCFAPGRGRLVLLIDWTLHRDRCRSLWVMLPVGGRAVPLCFFLSAPEMGGKGKQREFEDACLRQLAAWLPRRRRVVLVGDRGFRGADRMRFLREELHWHFVLRITGETLIQPRGAGSEWLYLRYLQPALGAGWEHAEVVCGKAVPRASGKGKGPVVRLIAGRSALLTPRPVLNNKGKRTGKVAEEATWFLATSLSASTDAVELYQRRMQVEQTFRDFKSLLGMEREQTRQPWQRLQGLLWAVMVGMTLDLHAAEPTPQASAPKRRFPQHPPRAVAYAERYRRESATREGMHRLVVALVLEGGEFAHILRALAQTAQRMQARLQVAARRRPEPAVRNRSATHRGARSP